MSELKEFIENKHVGFEVVNVTENGAMVTLSHDGATVTKTLTKDMMARGYALWEDNVRTTTFARLEDETSFEVEI